MRRDTSSVSSSLNCGGRGAVGIVDTQIATSAVLRGGRLLLPEKITSSMSDGAHGLVRGLAHHPAQRFDQIGLAAAVRPDDAGQARLDQEIGRFDKGLEAERRSRVSFISERSP